MDVSMVHERRTNFDSANYGLVNKSGHMARAKIIQEDSFMITVENNATVICRHSLLIINESMLYFRQTDVTDLNLK